MRRVLLALTAIGAAVAGVVALLRRRRSSGAPDRWGSSDDGGGRLEYHGPSGDPLEAGGGSPDDARLLARVQSELFRDAALPKGDIALDAVGGVITLRGQVDEALVADVPIRVAAVEGVLRVENLLHAPGSPPPVSA
ncbi:BON domain-containing protein [Miltoncostaea oceani]|uniref:BON domain-containing protein n=1 Tax=Miltoncostaea oceani TaxID=2843216 RepID=UPI001C3D5A55|nr:BON domain-containing protein [Miltoncostaea oceani]